MRGTLSTRYGQEGEEMNAIERINQMAALAKQQSEEKRASRLASRAEVAKRNRERYPELGRILDVMNTTFTIKGKTYPGGFMAKIVEIEDL